MARSKQTISSSDARTSVRQLSDATAAEQRVEHVKADSIEQKVQSSGFDLKLLAEQLTALRASMRQVASTAEDDLALGSIAAAETAAKRGDEAATLHFLKAGGKWALDVAEKIGVGLAVAALKSALGF